MKLQHTLLVAIIAAVATVPPTATVMAGGDVVIARDYPNAAVFMQMARRGIVDYTARNGAFPPGLQALQDGGYTAYLFPTNWRPGYEQTADQVRLNLYGHPVYVAGHSVKTSNITVVRPQPGLYHDVARDFPDTSSGRVVNRQGVDRVWNFPGAQWLAAGKSWSEVDRALRFERIAIHLNWMTYEFNQANRAMPDDLRELETYLGTERNALGWQGVTEVGSLAAVAWEPGNLFVGWDHNGWVVSMNLGWGELDTHRWTPGRQGFYHCNGSLVY
jgi:hypothetical protein